MKCLIDILDEAHTVYALSRIHAKTVGYTRKEMEDRNSIGDTCYSVTERVESPDGKVVIRREFTTDRAGCKRNTMYGVGTLDLYVSETPESSSPTSIEYALLSDQAAHTLTQRLLTVFAKIFRAHDEAEKAIEEDAKATERKRQEVVEAQKRMRVDRAHQLAKLI